MEDFPVTITILISQVLLRSYTKRFFLSAKIERTGYGILKPGVYMLVYHKIFFIHRALTIKTDPNILEQLAMLYYGSGRNQESLDVFKRLDTINNQTSSDTVVRHVSI